MEKSSPTEFRRSQYAAGSGFHCAGRSLQKQITRHWRIAVDAENLTDRHYIATQTGPIKTLGAPLLIVASPRAQY
jgi:hypothetical protein